MKNPQWVMPDGNPKMKPTPQSGGEGVQLGGFDGRERVIAAPSGANRTADILSRDGKHVPKAQRKEAQQPKTPSSDFPEVNDGPQFRSEPQVKIEWPKKGYLKSKG